MNFNYLDMMISNIIEQSVKQILLPRVFCISYNNSLDYLDELHTIIKEHYENMWKSLQHKSFALSEWNQFKNNFQTQFSIYLTPILSTVTFSISLVISHSLHILPMFVLLV